MTIWIQVGVPEVIGVASNDSPLASSPEDMLLGQCEYVEKAGELPCD